LNDESGCRLQPDSDSRDRHYAVEINGAKPFNAFVGVDPAHSPPALPPHPERPAPVRLRPIERQRRDKSMETHTQRIRALNDDLRRKLTGGLAVMTPGIAALGPEAVERIVKTIAVFDDFCHANDPHEEHDFGSFEAESETIFFKIDYFDRNFTYHSPDPADPAVTRRVITIMLASEY